MSSSTLAVIDELRAQVQKLQGPVVPAPLAVHPVLADLVTLRAGASYQVAGLSLAMLLMAGPSAAGAWCAVVGIPDFGVEAARELGIDTTRLVVVPQLNAEELLAVLSALIDVVDVVLVAGVHVTATQSARLSARMRDRGCFLITAGPWPRTEAQLRSSSIEWRGIGEGYGHLQARQVTVEVRRQDRLAARRRIWFPDHELRVRPVDAVLRSVP